MREEMASASTRVCRICAPCEVSGGATTVDANQAGQIVARSEELLSRMISENGIQPDEVASAVFTVTDDLDAEFPAVRRARARRLGRRAAPVRDGDPRPGLARTLCAHPPPLEHGSLWSRKSDTSSCAGPASCALSGRAAPKATRAKLSVRLPRPPAVSRVAVVGLGLIGGSLALASGARGYDRDPGARGGARKRGIDTADSLESALNGADFVFLAVSTSETTALLAEAAAARPGALFSDCASLKVPVMRAAAMLPASARFVGGHPMAGSRKRGLAGADADLFQGRPWVLVPTARTDERALAAVGDLVAAIGAVPVVLDADTHDAAMTRVSHLPHAVSAATAIAAARTTSREISRLAGPGLLDATRLAEAPIDLLLELALADPQSLANAIGDVTAELTSLRAALIDGDPLAVRAFFKRAGAARKGFSKG